MSVELVLSISGSVFASFCLCFRKSRAFSQFFSGVLKGVSVLHLPGRQSSGNCFATPGAQGQQNGHGTDLWSWETCVVCRKRPHEEIYWSFMSKIVQIYIYIYIITEAYIIPWEISGSTLKQNQCNRSSRSCRTVTNELIGISPTAAAGSSM